MDISSYTRLVMKKLLDSVFPIICVGCGMYCVEDDLPYLCRDCRKKIVLNTKFECIGCKEFVPQGHTCFLCSPEWSLDRLFIAADYAHKPVARLIHILKYGFATGSAETLGDILREYIGKEQVRNSGIFSGKFLLIPVPASPRRLRWRGFNQTELIAQKCFSEIGFSVSINILERKIHSGFQANLEDRSSRFEAAKNVFSVAKPHEARGRHVILVDDVCTTGATLNECAKALKQSGALSASALVIARNGLGGQDFLHRQ